MASRQSLLNVLSAWHHLLILSNPLNINQLAFILINVIHVFVKTVQLNGILSRGGKNRAKVQGEQTVPDLRCQIKGAELHVS